VAGPVPRDPVARDPVARLHRVPARVEVRAEGEMIATVAGQPVERLNLE
jgi:hypothetical protein